jgi:hypothetical protein
MTTEAPLRKAGAVDEDVIDDDLILMHLETRRVVILNPSARAIWDAIGDFPTRGELLAILREARPDGPPGEDERSLDELLATLAGQGFLEAPA